MELKKDVAHQQIKIYFYQINTSRYAILMTVINYIKKYHLKHTKYGKEKLFAHTNKNIFKKIIKFVYNHFLKCVEIFVLVKLKNVLLLK